MRVSFFGEWGFFPGVRAAGNQVQDSRKNIQYRHHAPERKKKGFAKGMSGRSKLTIPELNEGTYR